MTTNKFVVTDATTLGELASWAAARRVVIRTDLDISGHRAQLQNEKGYVIMTAKTLVESLRLAVAEWEELEAWEACEREADGG